MPTWLYTTKRNSADLAAHGEKFKDFLPVVALTDCKSLFDSIQKEGGGRNISEKRLMIDLAAIKEMLTEYTPDGGFCQAMTSPYDGSPPRFNWQMP